MLARGFQACRNSVNRTIKPYNDLFLSVPAPEHKKPTDYVTGLFRVEATLQPRPRRRLSLEEPTTPCSENGDEEKK